VITTQAALKKNSLKKHCMGDRHNGGSNRRSKALTYKIRGKTLFLKLSKHFFSNVAGNTLTKLQNGREQ
jgi:hypothetical protein